MKTLVVTRHGAFVEFLLNQGVVEPGNFEVVPHVVESEVADRVVVTSGIPLHLAAICKRVVTVPLHVPPEFRGKELSVEEVERFAQPVQSFVVRKV